LIFNRKIVFFISFFSFLLSVDNLQHIKNITSLVNSTSIELLDDNRLLIGTTGGIYTSNFSGNNFTDYTKNLQYANINTIAKDEESNNIWLGGGDGNIQVLDDDLNLKYIIDYIPFEIIKKIIFYDNYTFAIGSYQNKDVIVQYSRYNNPSYLNYFIFNDFEVEDALNNNQQIIDVSTIYDIVIEDNMMYLGTDQGLLSTDLSFYNNNLLLLLDWFIEDQYLDIISFVENYESIIYLVLQENSSGINLSQFGISVVNEEEILKSFYFENICYILLKNQLISFDPMNFSSLNVIFDLPDNIYSNFTDIKMINSNLYFSLENHGIIKTSQSNIDEYDYIIPNTIFTNRIIAIDINESKELVALGGDVDIAQGGFLINNILDNHYIENFYADSDNYEDFVDDCCDYFETYKYKYPNNEIIVSDTFKGKNLLYVSGDKNSEGVKFNSTGDFYLINNCLYLEPEIYHCCTPYNPFKDQEDYFLSGLLHIDSSDLTIIDGWDSVFTGINYSTSGYNYTTLANLYHQDDNFWIINPQAEGAVNTPLVVKSNESWISIEDNSNNLYFLPEEIAFDNNDNVWIAYQKDDNESYSPGGIKMLRLNESVENNNYTWWSDPLSIVSESECYQYNNDLDLDNVSVWSLDIGSDQYGNTILWTLSDYGVMGYVIDYSFSGYFNFLSLKIEPISCNFYFSNIPFDKYSKVRVDNQNNVWISSNSGLRMIRNNGELGFDNDVLNSSNSSMFSDIIYDLNFDNNGYIYVSTDLGISIFKGNFAKEQPVSKISVSPNPFIIGQHSSVTFSNLPSNSIIQIMNLSGRVVKEFLLTQETILTDWDGKDNSGRLLSTGIYLVAAINTSNGEVGVTKLAVIRN